MEIAGGACRSCGYKACEQALQFHHLDPSKKDMVVSSPGFSSWDRAMKELEKCILLCANCHAEVHAGIRKLPMEEE